jgi:hypothetical protein
MWSMLAVAVDNPSTTGRQVDQLGPETRSRMVEQAGQIAERIRIRLPTITAALSQTTEGAGSRLSQAVSAGCSGWPSRRRSHCAAGLVAGLGARRGSRVSRWPRFADPDHEVEHRPEGRARVAGGGGGC